MIQHADVCSEEREEGAPAFGAIAGAARWLVAWSWVVCVLAACATDDSAPVFVKIAYQVRCLECEPRAADEPAHDVNALDGESGYRASCTHDSWNDMSVFSVSLKTSARQVNGNEGFAFELRQILVGDDPGSSCRVRTSDGPNAYEGRCSAEPPSADVPCQLKTRSERGVLLGSVLCEEIPNSTIGALRRSLVNPGGRDAAEFEVHGCPDL